MNGKNNVFNLFFTSSQRSFLSSSSPPCRLNNSAIFLPPISYYSLPLFLLPVLRASEDVFEAPLAWPPTALGSSSLEGIRRDSLSIIQTGRARGPLGLRPLGRGGPTLYTYPLHLLIWGGALAASVRTRPPKTSVYAHFAGGGAVQTGQLHIYCTCRPGIFIASLLFMKAIRRLYSSMD